MTLRANMDLAEDQLKAQAGDILAIRKCAIYFWDGKYAEKDEALSRKYCAIGVARGDEFCEYFSATRLNDPNDKAMFEKVCQMADANYLPALHMKGLMILHGKGAAKNEAEGWRHIERAAARGHFFSRNGVLRRTGREGHVLTKLACLARRLVMMIEVLAAGAEEFEDERLFY